MIKPGPSIWTGLRALHQATKRCPIRIADTQPASCKSQVRVRLYSNNAFLPSHTRELLRDAVAAERGVMRFGRARRRFSISVPFGHGHLDPPKPGKELHVTIVDQDSKEHTFEVAEGDNLLDIAQANDLDMEGACGGSCACATCHVIFEDQEKYDELGEPSDDEEDMLSLAFGLTETSRLGCQVKMSPAIEGLKVKLPLITRNVKESDFKKRT
ncbi:MAG: mitochondrial matrix iron-sulfur protein [Candelina submexicana]|nr:MAG: mitochondrial matrix iron-sulfur protein [Candelina submexicana]